MIDSTKPRRVLDYVGCYLFDSRKHKAPIAPYELYRISPDEIIHAPINTPSLCLLRPSPITDGNWDQHLRKFRKDVVYRSFEAHFKRNVKWKQTDYYQFMLDRIAERGSYKSMTESTELQNRCNQLDQLYDIIKKEGYKTQQELRSEKVSSIDTEPLLPPERKEITVHISRNGEFLWSGGAHRLAITKLLDIETIPVRINIRHQQWQKIRDKVYKGEPVDGNLQGHPDLQFDS